MRSIRLLQARAGLLLACLLVSGMASAQTAFTYQGQLQNQGAPAEGLHDFRFELFDQSADGTSLAGPVQVDDLPVANGLFNALIDFGEAFDGSPVWIEISVRAGADEGAFAVLSPRQPITPTPLALQSEQLDGRSAEDFALAGDLTVLGDQLAALQARIDALENPVVLGVTTATTNGAISFNGETGLKAAHAMCQDEFGAVEPRARLCSLNDLQRALVTNGVPLSLDNVFAWVLTNEVGPDNRPPAHYLNSCRGFLDANDVGTRAIFVFDIPGASLTGDVIGLDSAPCGQIYPLMCCR